MNPARDSTAPEIKVLVGIACVAIGTRMFSNAARKLGWPPILITLALYGASRAL